MDVREKLVEIVEKAAIRALPKNTCHTNIVMLVNALIEEGVTVREWISVKDRLPPYNHDVLVYRPNMAMKIMVDSYNGHYGEDDNEWYEGWAKYGKDINNNPLITHWAFLPQPPKGE